MKGLRDLDIVDSFYVVNPEGVRRVKELLSGDGLFLVMVASEEFVGVTKHTFQGVLDYLQGCLGRRFYPWVAVGKEIRHG